MRRIFGSYARAAAALTLGLAVLGLAAPAAADEAWDRAKGFFKAGEAAYEAGDFSAAAQAFGEAYALAQRPQILFSMAQAERKQYVAQRQAQDLGDAIKHYRTYLDQVPRGGRRADAADALAELEGAAARAPLAAAESAARRARTRIMVSANVKDAVFTLDGTAHDESPLIAEVMPGKHRVKIAAKGYFDDEREVTSVEGTLVAIEVPLKEQPARLSIRAPGGTEVAADGRPSGTAPLAPLELAGGAHTIVFTRTGSRPVVRNVTLERGGATSVAVSLRDTSQRTGAYVVLGLAGAATAGGGVLAAVALAKEAQAKDVLAQAGQHTILQSQLDAYGAARATRDTLRTGAIVAFGSAGALAAAAVALYAFDHPTPQREDLAPVRAAVVPLPGGAVAALGGRF